MNFKEIVMKRYATKVFDSRKVPESKVNELLELIRYSPSSFNIQPWKILVITDKDIKEKLLPVSWNQPQITSCSHLIVFCANKDIKGNIDLLEKTLIKNGAKIDGIKGYVDLMKNFEIGLTDDAKLSWAQKQVYIALSNALNGAKSLGFDSCPMEGFDAKAYSKILDLPSNLVPTVVCPIGYGTDIPNPKIRFSLDEIKI